MIINKTTSDAVLVSTLVVIDSNGKPVKDVTEFDTTTLEATLSVGGPVTAYSYEFATSSEQEQIALYALLDDEFEPRITMSTKKYKAVKAMDDTSTPDDFLTFNSHTPSLNLQIATCTNCSTKFLIFIDADGEIWNGEKVGGGDTFQTLTPLNEAGLTCDFCSNSVAMYDENPF